MALSNRQVRILDILRGGDATSHYLAQQIDAPMASVRRDIQGLRHAGYSIPYYGGLFRLA